jgi:hypothetical protein
MMIVDSVYVVSFIIWRKFFFFFFFFFHGDRVVLLYNQSSNKRKSTIKNNHVQFHELICGITELSNA